MRVMMFVSCLVPPVSAGAALGGGGRHGSSRRLRLRFAVRLVRFDDLVFGLGTFSAGLGALDLHFERGALCIRFGARRHAARLVSLLYVGIEVYNKVADADVPLVVIVLEVGGMRVGRGASSAGRRALPHWRRHARRSAPPAPRCPARAHTIVARSQVDLVMIRDGNPKETQSDKALYGHYS